MARVNSSPFALSVNVFDKFEKARIACLSDGPKCGAAKHFVGMSQERIDAGGSRNITDFVQGKSGVSSNAVVRIVQG